MLVKKFEAENMAAALKQVKATLGSDALILSTRTIGKKGLGVLGRQTIEVTAAIESPAMKNTFKQPEPEPRPEPRRNVASSYGSRVETLEDEQVSLSWAGRARKVQPQHETTVLHQASPAPANPLEEEIKQLRAQLEAQNVNKLQSEIDQLKELMAQMTRVQVAGQTGLSATAPAVELKPAATQQVAAEIPIPQIKSATEQSLETLLDMLVERGIDKEAATTIARFAAPQMSERQRQEPEQCRNFLTHTIAGLVQTTGPLWSPGDPQKRISLVGATGVGKTTTIAKLAAEAITRSGARVALITIDTYRIAAVEQLKVYGEIMGVPVDVVLSPEQLQDALRRHQDKDLILIDTAGRSPRDQQRIEELSQFLGNGSGIENCLVLAAPTEERLQQKTLECFGTLPLARLIFTKLDETDRCGTLINVPLRSNLPLAYLTNGQQVPEDLLRAEAKTVADLVMGKIEEQRRMAV